MIFNIQKCSIHDGHGLRTLVFFKGCPLKCKWCANPESQNYEAEIMESPSKCIGCGLCMKVCPQTAISLKGDGPRINRDKCMKCFQCVDTCYAEAKVKVGNKYTTEELFKEIEKDRIFYEMKGGGVTFSGGEPLTYPKELTAIAKMCREKGINVGMESCGCGKFDEFKTALPYIDSTFMDIKHIDNVKHRELTGSGNGLILENIRRIAEFGVPITIRTPVIPGLNDSAENIRGIAEFICSVPQIKEYELLPYHQFGINKYKAMGRPYELEKVAPPDDGTLKALVRCANQLLDAHGKVCFYTKENERVVIK